MKNEAHFVVLITERASLHASDSECFIEAARLLLHICEANASLIKIPHRKSVRDF